MGISISHSLRASPVGPPDGPLSVVLVSQVKKNSSRAPKWMTILWRPPNFGQDLYNRRPSISTRHVGPTSFFLSSLLSLSSGPLPPAATAYLGASPRTPVLLRVASKLAWSSLAIGHGRMKLPAAAMALRMLEHSRSSSCTRLDVDAVAAATSASSPATSTFVAVLPPPSPRPRPRQEGLLDNGVRLHPSESDPIRSNHPFPRSVFLVLPTPAPVAPHLPPSPLSPP